MPNLRGNEDLCKLGKECLSDLLCKFGPFRLQHSKTLDISHAFLRVTIAVLSTLKQVRFFGSSCMYEPQILRACLQIQFEHDFCNILTRGRGLSDI